MGAFSQYMVAKHLGFQVILTGHGGDELFLGILFSYMKHGIMGIRSVTDFSIMLTSCFLT